MLSARLLKETEFTHIGEAWNTLLLQSHSNSLFLSWQWQYTWWEQWSKPLDLELLVVVVFDRDQLVGVLPLFCDNKLQRIEFIGNHWRKSDTVRTEHLDAILHKSYPAQTLLSSMLDCLFSVNRGSEFLLTDIDSPLLVEQLDKNYQLSSIERSRDEGVRVDTSGNFEDYLSSLGKSTQQRIFKQRDYIARHYGHVEFEHVRYDDRNSVLVFFDALNRYHLTRWGSPCFDSNALAFHQQFIARAIGSEWLEPQLSLLKVNEEVVSVLYDIRAGNTVFNIQSGYDQNFGHRTSLGTLHIGFALERAFENDVLAFDLLVGKGRSSDYKKRFAGQRYSLPTYLFVQKPLHKLALNVYKALPQKHKSRMAALRRLFKH